MKKLFKPGERVYVRGVSEEIKNAIIARFQADGWEPYYNVAGYIGIYGESERDCTDITIEDCLFRGAPPWAVDVLYSEGGFFYWTDCKNLIGYFGGGHQVLDALPNEKIVYTRKPVETEKPWYELEGALPPVGEVVEFHRDYSCDEDTGHYKDVWFGPAKVFHVTGSGCCFVEYENGEFDYSKDQSKFRPIPTIKKIDMSKFAGTDVWLVHINNDEKRNQAKEFYKYPNIMREAYKPLLHVWNHWTGDKEPEWLEGFEYEVKAWDGTSYRIYKDIISFNSDSWGRVCAIKILRIKDGWELP